MDNLKKSCKLVSDIMEIVILIVLSILILTKNKYVGILAITISGISIVITILSSENFKPLEIIKNMKLYFFIDALLFAIAKIEGLNILYYITIIVGVALLLISFVFLSVSLFFCALGAHFCIFGVLFGRKGGEIPCYLRHAGRLPDSEGAAAVAMTAAHAAGGVDGELAVMIVRHFIPRKGKIVILVHKPYVNACGTGSAMVAVHAVPPRRFRSEAAYDGIIPFLRRSLKKGEQLVKVLKPSYAGHG